MYNIIAPRVMHFSAFMNQVLVTGKALPSWDYLTLNMQFANV